MTESDPAASADEQLAAIDLPCSALGQRSIDYWLFGGWAVDFWVGAVTREHDDIDVVAWREDYDVIGSALTAAGWRHTPTPNDIVGTRYRWMTAEVEFTFVVSGADGEVLIPLPGGPIVWSATSLGHERRRLRGVECRTIPLELLRAGKEHPRDGEPAAAKDIADYQALSRLAP